MMPILLVFFQNKIKIKSSDFNLVLSDPAMQTALRGTDSTEKEDPASFTTIVPEGHSGRTELP